MELKNESACCYFFFNSKMSDQTDGILLEILAEMKTANQNSHRQVDLLDTLVGFVQNLMGMVRMLGRFMGAF